VGVTLPNVIKVGQTVAEISQFSGLFNVAAVCRLEFYRSDNNEAPRGTSPPNKTLNAVESRTKCLTLCSRGCPSPCQAMNYRKNSYNTGRLKFREQAGLEIRFRSWSCSRFALGVRIDLETKRFGPVSSFEVWPPPRSGGHDFGLGRFRGQTFGLDLGLCPKSLASVSKVWTRLASLLQYNTIQYSRPTINYRKNAELCELFHYSPRDYDVQQGCVNYQVG